jgi:IS1 family transposase
MNYLDTKQRAQILTLLVEGMSINATCRATGAAKNTVLKLLADAGKACAKYHDENVRRLQSKRVQCDEIWSFCYAKQKNVAPEKQGELGFGDVYTWTALDADSKLMISYLVGKRDSGYAHEFMIDVANRLSNRVQMTTDGHKPYLEAIETAFGSEIDYAMLIKLYGAPNGGAGRYSPAECKGTIIGTVQGCPEQEHISTSYVERQNLTMRMHMRRFTRLTNGFSKKIENHMHAVALHFMFYNFCKIHKTLRVTPAMEAGISQTVWSLENVVELIEKDVQPKKRGSYKKKDSN